MLSNHIILGGLGRVGRRVLEYLQAAGVPVVVIDSDVSPRADTATTKFLCGDFRKRELLDQAGLADARGVLILTSDDLVNLSGLMTVVHARPGLRVVIRMFNPPLVRRLGAVVSNVFALSTSALTAPMLALIAHTGGALASFDLADDQPFLVTEWTLPVQHSLVGKRLADVKRDAGVDLVAHHPPRGSRTFFADFAPEATLSAGDQLIVAGAAPIVEALTGVAEVESGRATGLGDHIRRFGRMARKIIAEIDLPVRICTAILVLVIVVSVLIFRIGMKNDTVIDAFYRTISLMATGADMRGQDAEPGSWQKGFISLLRILGAALTAAFTAILTNYLVRAQLGGALEVRRIPERGHVIITGLGNVSFRAIEELIRLGEEVVAIERNRNNAFIATARQLGAIVIIGDALVDQVLKQAHAEGAKAVLVATEDELANLEIALSVRELLPHKRLLVRLIDPQLAHLLREAANIHLALSIPELAAPAFLAAFVGDRMRTVLLAHSKLVAVIDVTVHPNDTLAGRSVGEWAREYRLLPIAATLGDRSIDVRQTDAMLPSGATLTALVTFRDVHALFQRGSGMLG